MTKTTADKIAKSLSFEVEATPLEDVIQVRNSDNATPLNVKVKVRKREDGSEVIKRGMITLPRNDQSDTSPERVRLASSDQTIMSFNVLMEADFEKRKENAKPRKNFFGLCLGAQSDDDSQYAPSAAGKSARSQSDSSMSQNKGMPSKIIDNSQSPRKKDDPFFGKCKPGGCLDPPFGEDNYSYQPKLHKNAPAPNLEKIRAEDEDKKLSADIDSKTQNEVPASSESKVPSKEEKKSYSVLSLYHGEPNSNELEGKDSDSIITYPPTLSSSGQNLEEEKKERRRPSNTRQSRNSFNESNGPYYTPPKPTIISGYVPVVTSIPKDTDSSNRKSIQRNVENDNLNTDQKHDPNIEKMLEKAITTNIMPVPVVSKQHSINSSTSENKRKITLQSTNSKDALKTSPENIGNTEPLETLSLIEKDPHRKGLDNNNKPLKLPTHGGLDDLTPKLGTFKTTELPRESGSDKSYKIKPETVSLFPGESVNENRIHDGVDSIPLETKESMKAEKDRDSYPDYEIDEFDKLHKNIGQTKPFEILAPMARNPNRIGQDNTIQSLKLPTHESLDDVNPKLEIFKTALLPKVSDKDNKNEIKPETVPVLPGESVNENRIQDGVKSISSETKDSVKTKKDKHSYPGYENDESDRLNENTPNTEPLETILPSGKDPDRKGQSNTIKPLILPTQGGLDDLNPKLGTFKTAVLSKESSTNKSNEIKSETVSLFPGELVSENRIQDGVKTIPSETKKSVKEEKDKHSYPAYPGYINDESDKLHENIAKTEPSETSPTEKDTIKKGQDNTIKPQKLPAHEGLDDVKTKLGTFETAVLPKESGTDKKKEVKPESVSLFPSEPVNENRIEDGIKSIPSATKESVLLEKDKKSYPYNENDKSSKKQHDVDEFQSPIIDNNSKTVLRSGTLEEPFKSVDDEKEKSTFDNQKPIQSNLNNKESVPVSKKEAQTKPTKPENMKSTNSKILGERVSRQSSIVKPEELVSRQSKARSKDSIFARLSRRQSNKSKESVSTKDQNSIKSRISATQPIHTPMIKRPSEEKLKEETIATTDVGGEEINRFIEEANDKTNKPHLNKLKIGSDPIPPLVTDGELKGNDIVESNQDPNAELINKNQISISQTHPKENIENARTQPDTGYTLKRDEVPIPKLESEKQIEYEIKIESEVDNDKELNQNISFDIRISDVSHKSSKLEIAQVAKSSSKKSEESAMKAVINKTSTAEINTTPSGKTYDKIDQKSTEVKSYDIDETKSSKMISQQTYDSDLNPIGFEKDDKNEISNLGQEQNKINEILSFEINGPKSNSDIVDFSIQYDPNLQKDKMDVISVNNSLKPLEANASMQSRQNLPMKSIGTDMDRGNLKESEYISSKDQVPSEITDFKTVTKDINIESSKFTLKDIDVINDSGAIRRKSIEGKPINYTGTPEQIDNLKSGSTLTTQEFKNKESFGSPKETASVDIKSSADTKFSQTIDTESRDIAEALESTDIKLKDDSGEPYPNETDSKVRKSGDKISEGIKSSDYFMRASSDLKPSDTVKGTESTAIKLGDDLTTRESIDIKSSDKVMATELGDMALKDISKPGVGDIKTSDIDEAIKPADTKSRSVDITYRDAVKANVYGDMKPGDRGSIAGSMIEHGDKLLKPRPLDMKSENNVGIKNIGTETLNIDKVPTAKLPADQLQPKDKVKKDSLFLDLTFQTHLEESQIIIKTLDSGSEYPSENNVSYIKSLVRLREPKKDIGINVPIGYDHIMNISIKSPVHESSSRTTRSISKFDSAIGQSSMSGVSSLRGFSSNLNTTVSSVYNHELLPLQQAIQYLKEDIDDLAKRQIALRDALENKTLKPTRTTHSFSCKGCYNCNRR